MQQLEATLSQRKSFVRARADWRAFIGRNTALVLAVTLTSGCASQLTVSDSSGRALPGVPVPTPVTFVESGTYTKLVKGGVCEAVPYQTAVTLPVGPPVFINVKPAMFAKTGLDIKFGQNGAAQEISLNTEPSGADLIKNTADAIKTLAPLVGVGAAPARANDPALTSLPPCDSVPDPSSVRRSPLRVGS